MLKCYYDSQTAINHKFDKSLQEQKFSVMKNKYHHKKNTFYRVNGREMDWIFNPLLHGLFMTITFNLLFICLNFSFNDSHTLPQRPLAIIAQRQMKCGYVTLLLWLYCNWKLWAKFSYLMVELVEVKRKKTQSPQPGNLSSWRLNLGPLYKRPSHYSAPLH